MEFKKEFEAIGKFKTVKAEVVAKLNNNNTTNDPPQNIHKLEVYIEGKLEDEIDVFSDEDFLNLVPKIFNSVQHEINILSNTDPGEPFEESIKNLFESGK